MKLKTGSGYIHPRDRPHERPCAHGENILVLSEVKRAALVMYHTHALSDVVRPSFEANRGFKSNRGFKANRGFKSPRFKIAGGCARRTNTCSMHICNLTLRSFQHRRKRVMASF